MHVVVTGASGNVATALLKAISARHPDWTVTGICRRPPGPTSAPYQDVRWVAVDLTADSAGEQVSAAARGADALIHLAWAMAPSHDRAYLARVNLDGSRRVFQAARTAAVGHLVHASSVGTYRAVPSGADRGIGAGPVKPRVTEDWPTDGIPTSSYSRHKAAAERLLDEVEQAGPGGPVVTRLRPGLVMQSAAGSEVARYFLGSALPAALLRRLPLVPLPRALLASAVHADDLAEAIVAILERQLPGGVNVAADDPLSASVLAGALGARPLAVPPAVARGVVDLSWRARLQPTDAGWLDLALGSPLLDTGRARRELDWAPRHSAQEALRDVLEGMIRGVGTASPALAPRSLLRDLVPNRARMRMR